VRPRAGGVRPTEPRRRGTPRRPHERHVALARAYLDLKREKFDDWFLAEYEPQFFRNYTLAWAERRGGALDLADDVGRRSYARDVIAEYDSLASQLRESREQFLSRLDAGYAETAQANAAVGALLRSAVAVHEADRWLWDKSVGRAVPGLRAENLDRVLEDLQSSALRGLRGTPESNDHALPPVPTFRSKP
jgi:hypothetical protein